MVVATKLERKAEIERRLAALPPEQRTERPATQKIGLQTLELSGRSLSFPEFTNSAAVRAKSVKKNRGPAEPTRGGAPTTNSMIAGVRQVCQVKALQSPSKAEHFERNRPRRENSAGAGGRRRTSGHKIVDEEHPLSGQT